MSERDKLIAQADATMHNLFDGSHAQELTDLDALVAEAGRSRVWPIPNMHDELCEAITDLRAEVERAKAQRDEAWQAFTRLRRAYSMVRYPTLTEELRLLYDAADAVAAGKSEGKA